MAFVLTDAVKSVILDTMRVVTSADKAYAYLRDLGYEWTRAFVREAWRETGKSDYWKTVIETYGTDKTIPKAWTIEKTTREGEGYQYVVNVTVQMHDTGRLEERYYSAIYNRLVPYETAFSDLESDIETYKVVYGFSVVDISPGGVINLVARG